MWGQGTDAQMPTTLGKQIREARSRNGTTLRQLARDLEISPGLLSLIERDRHIPPREIIVNAAKRLGSDSDYWCGLIGKVTPEVEQALASVARREPKFYRQLVRQWRSIDG